jgi:hypothetical protein
VGKDLGEGALGILAHHGASFGIQHPMDARLLVRCSEAERLHDPQTEFILGHAVRARVENSTQDRAAQQADEQVVVEVPA